MEKKTIFFIACGVVAVVFAGYWMYRQSTFSKEILRLEILGPENASMGSEVEYAIKYKNNGNFVLENPKLTFYMPDNSLTEDSKTMLVQNLKDIYPGSEEFVKIKTRLLGKEGDLKISKATISYTPKNLTARYESNTTFTTKINSVPITLDFDLPSKAEQGKDLQYALNYFSNVDYPLENLSVKIDPVPGFEFVSADPSSLDNAEWKLATLQKAQGGRITIKGRISGSAGQNLSFSAKLGMWQKGGFIVIKESKFDVPVIQPLLFISQQVNGSSSYVASPGETLHYQIFFRNIGNTPFKDIFGVVKLDGQALDISSIESDGGQVQKNSNMIVWDSDSWPHLRSLGTQEQGQISFKVKVKSDWVPSGQDAVISDEVNISQIAQKFSIKVNSGLVISQTVLQGNSEIKNSGPIPPVVGKATTYTVSWNIKNYFSDTKNVKVKALLPKNVSLTGKIFPVDEASNFSFDSASRQIVWSAGNILAGTGVKGDPYSFSFQVSLVPDSSQKGSVVPIIGTVSISGENQFTNTIISATDKGVDSSLPDDFQNSGGGIVQ